MSLVNLAEYEAAAREAVAGSPVDYFDGGSNDEITLRDNVAAFSRITLYPRMFRGVGRRDTSTTLVGSGARWPVIVAPVALLGMLSPDGEVPAARAATAAGSIFVLSSLSLTPIEDVVAEVTGPVWFQLYVYKDRAASEALVRRVEAAGCSALELTADTPILGRRERDVRTSESTRRFGSLRLRRPATSSSRIWRARTSTSRWGCSSSRARTSTCGSRSGWRT
jgi:4-hydroxymandelate oxidase